MTAFFIPGLLTGGLATEALYGELRRSVELDTGRRPSARRILQLWSRRGRLDCLTEVGQPDPVHGGTVMAIFDLGPHQPFVVCRRRATDSADGVRDVLDCNAYTVLEFDA